MLTFSYQVDRAGWARASIADGADQLDMHVSYLSDALRDLTEATISLLLGVDDVSFAWLDEPGVYEWHLHRRNGDVAITTIARAQNRGEDQVFHAICPLRHFANQVLQQLWAIFHDIGPDEDRRRWQQHDFPTAQYRRLESLLRNPVKPSG